MIHVTKKSGEKAPFSEDIYRNSLRNAGVSEEHIDAVIQDIQKHLYEGIPTTELYGKTFDILKSYSRSCAGRYSLKEGLRQLGPTGFPFERLTEKLFEHKGFNVARSQILQGNCITHELDVLAYTDTMCHMVECKFHSDLGYRMSVHVPMYMKSRFDDVHKAEQRWKDIPFSDYSQCWVVHNAKLSDQSKDFSECYNIHLLAWNYPRNEGLEYYIDKFGLYPVTTLTQLTTEDAHKLIKQDVVLCKEIADNREKLHALQYSDEDIDSLIQECDDICKKEH